jgi:2-polyprenyl-3-methyl-5-hydroxy-6-metoxy-1,4-benzoquinol methylase
MGDVMSFFPGADFIKFGYYSPLDRIHRLMLRWREKLGERLPASRLKDAIAYPSLKDVVAYTGLSAAEIRKRAMEKSTHKDAWFTHSRNSEADYRAFYQEDDWYIYWQPWKFRHYTWHFLTKMLPLGGSLVEYGCGVAAMTTWMSRWYPGYRYTVADIPSATLQFAQFRLQGRRNVEIKTIRMGREGLPLTGRYDLVVCTEVLEHTINPDEICEHFCDHLASGGLLYLNFQNEGWGGENLEEARERRPATLKILRERLHALKAIDEGGTNWGLYQARLE